MAPRERTPTLSDIEELVQERVGIERERTQTVVEWLGGRIDRLESRVAFWGVIPTLAVALATIAGILTAWARK